MYTFILRNKLPHINKLIGCEWGQVCNKTSYNGTYTRNAYQVLYPSYERMLII